MDYKQKYNKALGRAKVINPGTADYEVAVKIFPELKESKDEKIRKAILELVEQSSHVLNPMNQKSMIAWLKKQEGHIHIRKELFEHLKQSWYKEGFANGKYSGTSFEYNGHTWGMCARDNGVDILLDKQFFKHLEVSAEQKTADKVEPKFKVGDWVINKQGLVHQISNVIENVTNHTYGYDIVGGGYFNNKTEGVRLWTVQDAKDGDVLSFSDDTIVIFKSLYNDSSFHAYCYIEQGVFGASTTFSWWDSCGFVPATKKQRELLFQKMKEAGYEWDAEKNELKKIEQNPTWSEEDELNCNQAIYVCHQNGYSGVENWLTSIKERMKSK